ncbi:nucleotidyltransferase family protein [Kordiimonas pumila]|uniref:NTP transferase domain-containing protein n=1 Tax=Kordiimonas pumila TaxID=2161677 RepID=A0ABV7D2I4_9PROT|nr:nucleotidyltransferase family protein [Kordiimonas pumila]
MNECEVRPFDYATSVVDYLPTVSPELKQVTSPFTAVILAGTRCNNDPVASVFGHQYKALVPIYGQAMISRVVGALRQSPYIKRIVIVFDCPVSLYESCPELKEYSGTIDIKVVPCAKSICESLTSALQAADDMWPYLVTTADHALLTPAMVDEFCQKALWLKSDMAVGLVEKKYLDREHPQSKRTYLPFKGSKLSGANLFAFMGPTSFKAIRFWQSIEKERKKPWKLFSAFGWSNLAALICKRCTVDEAFERASNRLGVDARAIRLPFAEAAIDVDSRSDFLQVEKILALRDTLHITIQT